MEKQCAISFQISNQSDHVGGQILAAALLFLGLSACLWQGLGLKETGASPFLFIVVGLFYCTVACEIPKRALAFQAAAAAVLVLYTVLISRYIINGWNATMNAVFCALEQRLGYIFPRYEVTATELLPSTCAGLFLILPAILLGLLSAKTVGGGRFWLLPTAMILLALFVAGLSNLYPPDWCLPLLILGLTSLSVQRLTRPNVRAAGGASAAAHALFFALLLAICAIPALLWNGNGNGRALENRRAVERKLHQIRYEDSETTLPEGDFENLKFFNPGDRTALTITMDKPQELYLRGYVGETYTGNGWAGLEPGQKAKYATLFSWLHERGFYGQSQYAQLCQALGTKESGGTVSVTTGDACTGWRYAPYGLSDANADPRQISDAALPTKGLHGEKNYTLFASDVPITAYEQTANRLTAARKEADPSAIAYLTSENAYREFVYDSYLELLDETKSAISQVLTGLELPKQGSISFGDAQMVVRAYLSSAMTYSEDPKTIPEDEDFASGFLLDTKEGYSVHYATAAALMFRYLGIPARYVEGWYVSEETAAKMKPEEPTELDQSFAHAWVEIYRDGVGFVPFEITPPYTDPMEQSNMTQGGSGGAEIPPEEEPDDPLTPQQIVLLSLLSLALLLLMLFLTLILRRTFKRQQIRRLLETEDPTVAASNMTTWAIRLLDCMEIRYAGGSLDGLVPQVEQVLGKESARQFQAVLAVQRQALFSREGVSSDARAIPRMFLEQLETVLTAQGTWTERMRLRWILCVI